MAVDDYFQCYELFSNEDEFISRIASKNNDPTNVPKDEFKKSADTCNVKSTKILGLRIL